ncbi:uncharacterized protein LOC128128393 [Lactuca sativa]|uniref:uncharacterized protein LOC128128393 n=1 Tax=Lactuca sativa TaxID=4236 RepID=UPI0022AF67E2|nr:uncharacterized protein LOC128128393 [Lactuca sativa]
MEEETNTWRQELTSVGRLRGTLNGCGHLEQDWRILGLEEIVGQGGEGFWAKGSARNSNSAVWRHREGIFQGGCSSSDRARVISGFTSFQLLRGTSEDRGKAPA